MLRKNKYFYLDKDEDINKITDYILQDNPKNCKEYIDNIYLDKYSDRMDNLLDIEIEKENVFETELSWKYCDHVNCFDKILNNRNNCSNHQDKKYDF